jgi:hypothetical protein
MAMETRSVIPMGNFSKGMGMGMGGDLLIPTGIETKKKLVPGFVGTGDGGDLLTPRELALTLN